MVQDYLTREINSKGERKVAVLVNCILVIQDRFLFCFLTLKNVEAANKKVRQKPVGSILVFEVTVGDRVVECQDILVAYAGEVCH